MNSPKTHPLNVGYLVVGVLFLGIAGMWALRQTGIVDNDGIGWLFPLTLVAAGAIGLVAFAGRGLFGGRRAEHQQSAEEAAEIARLEAAAYAPYHTDIERTRTLQQAEPDAAAPQQTTENDEPRGENR